MKVVQKGVQASLVGRLRAPVSSASLEDKLNAIGEALAYIIEKKHVKRKIKLGKKKSAK